MTNVNPSHTVQDDIRPSQPVTATGAAADHAPLPVLEAHDLVKRFGALAATDHVSITVAEGEIHGLIGPNGAGKSTLIHLLSGSLRPDSGRLLLDGVDVSRVAAYQRVAAGLSRSFQITNTFRELSVRDNLLLAVQACTGSSMRFFKRRDDEQSLHERALKLAHDCAIDDAVLDQAAATLPHGEQRKLEFALTLASSPRILLLDEPMAGMGSDETQRLIELIETMRGRYAMLLVEHDMHAVFRLADRISVLVAGRIIASGTPDEIRSNATVIQAYLGDEEAPAAPASSTDAPQPDLTAQTPSDAQFTQKPDQNDGVQNGVKRDS